MAIALHVDEHGWSWPKVSTIAKSSRYGENAVQKALKQLCELKIRGKRVMLRAKEAPAHYVPNPKEKNYVRNFYLLFPDDAEVERYESEEQSEAALEGENPNHTPKKRVAFYGVGKRESLFMGSEKDRRSLNTKEEPSIKKNHREEEDTHTPELEPAPSLFDAPAQDSVCVSCDLTFEDYLGYARSKDSFTAPDAWARTNFPLRNAADDFLVREWLESRKPEAIAEARAAPVNQNLFFHEAVQRIEFQRRHGDDPHKVMESLPLDDEVRAQLIEKYGKQRDKEIPTLASG